MMNAGFRATLATALLAAGLSACTGEPAAPEPLDVLPDAGAATAEGVPPLEPAKPTEAYSEAFVSPPDNPLDPANAGPATLPYAEGSRPALYPPAPDDVLAAETDASAREASARAKLGPATDQPMDAGAQDAAKLEYVEPQFDEETGRYY